MSKKGGGGVIGARAAPERTTAHAPLKWILCFGAVLGSLGLRELGGPGGDHARERGCDVAEAVLCALKTDASAGKTYMLGCHNVLT